jgi:hypothetical protein
MLDQDTIQLHPDLIVSCSGVDQIRFFLPAARDDFRDLSARPIDGTGTAELSDGGGERLRGRDETGRRGTLSHLVLFPEDRPFFLGLSAFVDSAKEINPTRGDLVAVRRVIGTLTEQND